MFCAKCGTNLQDGSQFCPSCGSKVGQSSASEAPKKVTVMLDPTEVVPAKEAKDSSKTFSGMGKIMGITLMLVSIIGDLIAMFAIGFDSFIPITIGATVLFVIGFFLNMFSA